MEEETIENPLEISCEEAADIAAMQKQERASYMEDKLMEAHIRKCAACRELYRDEAEGD